jgi:hypothetical protein
MVRSVLMQLRERFSQCLAGGQADREHMYGLAWSRSEVAVWRFDGQALCTCETTGRQPFSWQVDNPGYQV